MRGKNYLVVEHDGLINGSTGGLLPAWAEALVVLGFSYARVLEDHSQCKATLAICLPRIEFAALFIALGMIRWKVSRSSEKEGLERLRSMLGTWVYFEVHGHRKVGRLEDVPENQDGYVRILTSMGRKLPNFEEMSLAKRKKYSPPQSGGQWSCVESKWWSSIKPTGRKFSERRDARADQMERYVLAAKDSELVEKLIGPGAAHWLMSSRERPVCIFGCKSRLDRELEEEISLVGNRGELKLGTVLRPTGSQEYEFSSHIQISACAKMHGIDPASIFLIEAGRFVEDNIRESSENNRVILLARNAPSYEQGAQAVKNAFLRRKSDFVLESANLPAHVKALSFIHK
jgi:hypothetical protein